MSYVTTVNSLNFSFAVSTDGVSVTIKPISKDGKKLFRFKEMGKEFGAKADGNEIFNLVAQYEQKLEALKAI